MLGIDIVIPDSSCLLHRKECRPAKALLHITTSSQGEPMSALSRIAMDDHKQIKLEAGGTVILSSRFIPGNQKTISRRPIILPAREFFMEMF